MADFKQALDWLNEGKSIRIKTWESDEFISRKSLNTCEDGGLAHGVFCNDWELYQEKPKHLCVRNEYVKCYELNGHFIWANGVFEIAVDYCPLCGKKAAE